MTYVSSWRTLLRPQRLEIIQQIERILDSKVLVFITGDRMGLETRIAMDEYPLIFKHLSAIGSQRRVALFIYTAGGDTMAAYGIANLVRQYADAYSVLIPYKALSAGTLIALGANKIFMTRGGILSPIDPSVQSALGPRVSHPAMPSIQVVVPVSVEDSSGFHRLAKDEWKLNDANLSEAFKALAGNVHPLALGAVHRAREQIAFLATNLLSYHIKSEPEVAKIVNALTKERFSHGYLIGKKEAKNVLGLPIQDENQELEEKMSELFAHYESLLELHVPYNQEALLGDQDSTRATFNRGIIESTLTTHVFRTIKSIRRATPTTPPETGLPQEGYIERNQQEAWVEDKEV